MVDKLDQLRKEMTHKFQTVKWSGHPCGSGSIFENTKLTREHLPVVVEKYDIHTIADAGAGDLSWIHATKWPHPVQYAAYDIYPRTPEVVRFDVTLDVLAPVDLILCRHVLNHIVPELATIALEKFEESKSKFIYITTFPSGMKHFEARWGTALEVVQEQAVNGRTWMYGLWRLP